MRDGNVAFIGSRVYSSKETRVKGGGKMGGKYFVSLLLALLIFHLASMVQGSTTILFTHDNFTVKDIEFEEVKGNYIEDIGQGSNYKIMPTQNRKLIKVNFNIIATNHDKNAIKKLEKKLKETFKMIPYHPQITPTIEEDFKLSIEKKKEIKGKHIFFDIKKVLLVDKNGMTYLPLWVVEPHKCYISLFIKDDQLLACRYCWTHNNKDYIWKYDVRSLGTFFGLLKTNKNTVLSIIFSVPNEIKSTELKLNIK